MEIQVHSSPEGLAKPVRVICCCGDYEDGWVEKIPGLPRREYALRDDEDKVVERGYAYDGDAVRAMGGEWLVVGTETVVEPEEPTEEGGIEARGKKKGGSRRSSRRKGSTSRPNRRRKSWVS